MLLHLHLALIPYVLAAPTRRTAITDGAAVGQTYDYVIAGGGLAGVVLAARLSEDTSKTALVIEAGHDESNNDIVTRADMYQQGFNTAIDWAYETVPQSVNGQSQIMRSGKALGGSTVINGMAWSKPHDFQLDSLETVGNPGLNWASLQTYMLRVENFHTPDESQGVTYTSSCRGIGGGIDTSIDGNPAQFEADFTQAVQGLGLPFVQDLTCGVPAGLGVMSHTSFNNIRSDAYRGYLLDKTKPNLTILTGAIVGRVILSTDITPRATGVEFRDVSGLTYIVNASEVIMATGSLRTPVILQHSGIGPTSFLASAGVQQLVDLPVGQNLIDQITTTTNWNINRAGGGGQPITWPRFVDLFKGTDAQRVTTLLENNLATWAQNAVNAGVASNAAGLQTVFEIQRDWILNRSAGITENYDYSYDTTMGWDSWFLLPFGRGSVRIMDEDAFGSFNIDPRYFENEFDALASGASARFTRTASNTSPLAGHVTSERDPGSGTGDSLDDWTAWAKDNYRSNWHPIGTVAMMSQELGGCVDSRHRVYGVQGLRVVDGSNLPFQVSSHLMSVLYGLAERAAQLIAEDNAGTNGT